MESPASARSITYRWSSLPASSRSCRAPPSPASSLAPRPRFGELGQCAPRRARWHYFLAGHFSASFPPALALGLPCAYHLSALRRWRKSRGLRGFLRNDPEDALIDQWTGFRLRAWLGLTQCRFKSCLRHLSGQGFTENRIPCPLRLVG